MDETRVLELALQNCHTLERSINESIKMVRRLNIRYNSDWLLKNYKNYMSIVWAQYNGANPRITSTAKGETSNGRLHGKPKKSSNLALSARSSQELCGINHQINYKFIKIKRSMEALLLQIQRAIDISNRQRNVQHLNSLARNSKTRICCH